MIYRVVPFPTTLRFQGHRVTTDAPNILYAQLTRDLFATAKFLVTSSSTSYLSSLKDEQFLEIFDERLNTDSTHYSWLLETVITRTRIHSIRWQANYQGGLSEGFLWSVDHVEEAVIIFISLIDLAEQCVVTDQRTIVDDQIQRLGRLQTQAASTSQHTHIACVTIIYKKIYTVAQKRGHFYCSRL